MFTMTRRSFLHGGVAAIGLPAAIVACAGDGLERAGIVVVPTPNGGIVPSAAFDAAARLQVAFVRDQDVFHTVSGDGGATFAAASRVNDRADFAQGGLFRGPEMAIDADGSVHVVWYSRAWELSKDKTEQGAMYSRSVRGAPFEPGRNIGMEPSDGLSVAARAGQVAIAWHNGDLLRVIRSDDAGASFSAATPVDALPCECCGTSLRIASDGQTFVVYRDRKEDRRDMFIAALARGAGGTRKLKLDSRSWIIKACPISGSGVSLQRAGLIAAWEHDGRILLSRLGLPAWQRSEPVAIGEGKYPVVLSNAETLLVAWSAGETLQWQTFALASLQPLAEGSVKRTSSHRAGGAVSPAGGFVLVV